MDKHSFSADEILSKVSEGSAESLTQAKNMLNADFIQLAKDPEAFKKLVDEMVSKSQSDDNPLNDIYIDGEDNGKIDQVRVNNGYSLDVFNLTGTTLFDSRNHEAANPGNLPDAHFRHFMTQLGAVNEYLHDLPSSQQAQTDAGTEQK